MAAREEETGGEQPVTEQISQGRRRLLAALAAAGGGGVLLTQQWAKPIVDLVVVPLHAQGSLCATSGMMTCGGITFTASAIFIVGIPCPGHGAALTACCRQTAWKRTGASSHRVRLSLSHNHPSTLQVKVDFFTFDEVGCTNSSSFGDTATNDIPAGQVFSYDGFVNGDFPECVGFRVTEVKLNGNQISDCDPGQCNSQIIPVDNDLGIYGYLIDTNGSCPP